MRATNRWYPVAQATLERHFPDVGERVFLNLAQATGVEVAVSVGTFVGRLRQLERDEAERSREARVLLAKRGLTEAVIAEPEALLGRFQTMPEPAPEEPEEEDRTAAEEAMWAWYLEWSTIARQAINDRNLFRGLGFLRSDRRSDDDAEVEIAPPTAPGAVVTAGPAAAPPTATASPV